ncbi:hypothetical protein AMTR_s00076p00183220 [Amborella trichopoda]|uniref:Uncharacterized protein n=1 Tax=Amborella trichopoda TaxID=13333 RepID=W1P4C1_AMBTC|nr:hypothetical protein AMTR_s00076p00183220 [Amborella trichopoda]
MNSRQRGLVDYTLFYLHSAYHLLHILLHENDIYLSESLYSIDEYHIFQPIPPNLKALLSAAMINQDTCRTRISRARFTDDLRRMASQVLVPIIRMLRNSLAMVKNMTETYENPTGKKFQ